MTIEVVVITVFAFLVFVILGVFIFRKLPKKLRVEKYTKQWKELQQKCRDKS